MQREIKRVLFMELDGDGRPFNVIVEDAEGYTHDLCFEYSKKYDTNYYYNAGSGPNSGTVVRQTFCGGEKVLTRFWAADDFDVTVEAELFERIPEQPFTEKQMFDIFYYAEEGEEDFEECGGLEYCKICDDWLPDFDQGDCPHIKWDRWWGTWIGAGINEVEPEQYKKAFFAVLKILGRSRAKYLRKLLLSHAYSIYWSSYDLVLRSDGKPRHLYCQGFRDIDTEDYEYLDRGLNWLLTLDSGKTDAEDMLTVSWISTWLADKPSRRKPLPDGFTTHHRNDEYELKYLGYPAGIYQTIDDVHDIVEKATEKAKERYPCLHDDEAISKYMNNLVNYREHRDRYEEAV